MSSCCSGRLAAFLAAVLIVSSLAPAQGSEAFAERLQAIMNRPEFRHSRFGIEIRSLDTGQQVFAMREKEFFVPGSTTKLLTEGTALELLGSDFRFHTRVYGTGKMTNGVLEGDVVLVASGDPNLSGRIQAGDTLGFEDEDHSYGGLDSRGLPGDPLLVIDELAGKIAARGIRTVKGRVLVDARLFPEGARELGTGVVISPIVVNDNVVDVIARPGEAEGAPVKLQISPATAYVQFVNHTKTAKAGTKPEINYEDGVLLPDGTRKVTVNGSLPLGRAPAMYPYPVPEPSRLAAITLVEALRKRGVAVAQTGPAAHVDFKHLSALYDDAHLLAEHISPPLSEEVRITLKVSQNLHASMTPFTLGAILSHATNEIDHAGFDREHDFLQQAGLDLSGAAQSDGAGGDAYFTPEFMVHYLLYMSKLPDSAVFHRALPILGQDGTLFNIQTQSPAAGHVFAKTGTFATYDALNRKLMVTGKGLAGYIDTASGQHLVFAAYLNMVDLPLDDADAVRKIAGEALGEIAAAAYDAPFATASAGPR